MVDNEITRVKRDMPVTSRGWIALGEALRRNGIVDPQAFWCVTWVKRFKSTAPTVPLGDRTPADVAGFLSALLGDPRFESWQISQASEALRILYQEVCTVAWASPWRQFGSPGGNARVRKRRSPATAEEVPLVLRLRTEIRMRHYSPRTERSYVNWALRFLEFRRGRDPRLVFAR